MIDRPTARPVSGEIMTGVYAVAPGPRAVDDGCCDVVEAEYEIVRPAERAGKPVASAAAPFVAVGPPPGGMNMLLGLETRAPSRFAMRGGPMFWSFGIGLAAAAFWISGGHALVRQAPFLSLERKAPLLAISDVTSRVDVSGAKPTLFVDGFAGNDGAIAAPLPPLEIHVTGNDGRLTRYKLGTSGRSMQPGEKFAFSSRLDAPKYGVRTVSVTFGE